MKKWAFTESELLAVVDQWLQEQHATGHEVAIRNAQFVSQQFISLLNRSDILQDSGVDIDVNELDLNNMDDFNALLGVDWTDLK
jgi:hypothetical protein